MSKAPSWSVIYFPKDNSVEAVPDFWFDKNKSICAWPVQTKFVKKMIENYQKPNKTNFTYHTARKLGSKSYGKI